MVDKYSTREGRKEVENLYSEIYEAQLRVRR